MATRKKTTKKKTTKKKTTKKKAAKKKAAKKKAAKKKTAKKKTAKKKTAKKKTAKKKTAKKKTAKKKTAKKTATKKKTAKKKATKKKATKRRTTAKRKTTKKKTTKRRAPAKKKATKRRTTAKRRTTTRAKRTAPRKPTAGRGSRPLRGASELRVYLRELDKAIERADRWIATVNTQSRNLAASFDDKLQQIANLDAALTQDQATLDAIRKELTVVTGMTPAITSLRERITAAAGTVDSMRSDLRDIAESRGVEHLFDWARGSGDDLLAKATCVSTADRFGTSSRSCGTRITPDSANEILDAARRRDFPALSQWVVRAQTPLVAQGSIPPTDEDIAQARTRIDRTLGPPPVKATPQPSGSPPTLPPPKPARVVAPPLPQTNPQTDQGTLDLDLAAADAEAQTRAAFGI